MRRFVLCALLEPQQPGHTCSSSLFACSFARPLGMNAFDPCITVEEHLVSVHHCCWRSLLGGRAGQFCAISAKVFYEMLRWVSCAALAVMPCKERGSPRLSLQHVQHASLAEFFLFTFCLLQVLINQEWMLARLVFQQHVFGIQDEPSWCLLMLLWCCQWISISWPSAGVVWCHLLSFVLFAKICSADSEEPKWNRIFNQINGIVRPAQTWTDMIKQDALNRRTGSKKVRDLALASRKVNLPRGDQKQDTLIKFFFKKKGIV